MTSQNAMSPLSRADELDDLLASVKLLILPFIRAADEAAPQKASKDPKFQRVLLKQLRPDEVIRELALKLPEGDGMGKKGLLDVVERVLTCSVNTWDQGFLDKLYASTNAVGVISELVLAVLNTNVHVFQVSPALTAVEKHTACQFARLFGFTGPHAGGLTCPGGSGSNLTSVLTARNTLFPATRTEGNPPNTRFLLFTSAHGHYSVEKAAVTLGLGLSAVRVVPVDSAGRMDAGALRRMVEQAKAESKEHVPLYVNATAGTTVLGAYDPLPQISKVCRDHNLWLHIDGSWGGGAVFSPAQRAAKLFGAHLADSLTVNPHKMLGVPVTCSFLLVPDVRKLHRANTLAADYLFHGADDSDDSEEDKLWDLADLTMQCGRRSDALKFALSWIYQGAAGLARNVDHAFAQAGRLAASLVARPDSFHLVSEEPPPCLQVCFYVRGKGADADEAKANTKRTKDAAGRLIGRGFMVDYAPGPRGSFLRVVVNCQTLPSTVDALVGVLEEVRKEMCQEEGRV